MSLEKALNILSEFDSDAIEKTAAGKVKARNRPAPIFDAKHPKVTDNKDHFPIDTIGRARNALARAGQFGSGKPSWYSGSAEQFKNSVRRAVKSKYPSIEVTEKKSKKKSSEELTALYKKAIGYLENIKKS